MIKYMLTFINVTCFFFAILLYQHTTQEYQNVQQLQIQQDSLQSEIVRYTNVRDSLQSDIHTYQHYMVKKVVATSYNSMKWQTNDEPFITASGTFVDNQTLALSRDLIQAENETMSQMGYSAKGLFEYGETVYVVYVKPMQVRDTMNKRYRNRADLWHEDLNISRQWGKREVFLVK